jgi:hypothetical protein
VVCLSYLPGANFAESGECKGSGGSRIEYIIACLGFTVWLSRAWLLRVRQEAEGGRPLNLRAGPHGLPLFHFQHHSSCRNRGHAHSSSLLCQNLSNAGHGRRVFKPFIESSPIYVCLDSSDDLLGVDKFRIVVENRCNLGSIMLF